MGRLSNSAASPASTKSQKGREATVPSAHPGQLLARELSLPRQRVETVIRLLDQGNTIPFLARYRKEQTGGLDEEVLRTFAHRLEYLRNLNRRRAEVQSYIEEQGQLTPTISRQLAQAPSLQALDDIYRPFRPRRRTRAAKAREQGLAPLAHWLVRQATQADDPPGQRTTGTGLSPADLLAQAEKYVAPAKDLVDAPAALAGARDILAQGLADQAVVRQWLRRHTRRHGHLVVERRAPAQPADTGAKAGSDQTASSSPYRQYYDYREPVRTVRPHRVLAINRGEKEGELRVRIEMAPEPIEQYLAGQIMAVADDFPAKSGAPAKDCAAGQQLLAAADDAYRRLLAPAVTRDIRNELTAKAQAQAINIFAANLKSLLLTPPLDRRTVMGLDPAYRTGCKLAVVDATGRLLANTVIYPAPPQNQTAQAQRTVLKLVEKYEVDVIAIGNGTASREAEAFIADLLPRANRPLAYTVIDEAGASVYSASELARQEFPGLEAADRGAVSIARRLQDPLAELVKIEPRALGIGQYQHDVSPKDLDAALYGVVESAVNTVGVNLNTASAALLSYVAGIGPAVAANIVARRESEGPFTDRQTLTAVPRLGPKTFQQCAGFVRVPDSPNPLDNTPIHPESYRAAKGLLRNLGFTTDDVTGPQRQRLQQALSKLDLAAEARRLKIGEPTLADIVAALGRPGRDPREQLDPPALRTDVLTMGDLTVGMTLTGTVRNVVDFGAFVDIGVGQDGLVHISQMSTDFIRHPLDLVNVGDVVQVTVLKIDPERDRIALSMK